MSRMFLIFFNRENFNFSIMVKIYLKKSIPSKDYVTEMNDCFQSFAVQIKRKNRSPENKGCTNKAQQKKRL